MSVVQHTHVTSSNPVISGEPAWVSLAESLAYKVPKSLDEAAITAASRLQEELRLELLKDSEWRSYAEHVYVEYSNGELSVYTDSQGATDLEYGTPEVPMNSKLRPFLRKATDKLQVMVTEAINKALS